MSKYTIESNFKFLRGEINIDLPKVIITLALIAIFVVADVIDNNLKNEINIIYNPAFVGEVVDKESFRLNPLVMFPFGSMRYQLHIVGEFIEDNETIQLDRVFTVSHSVYNRFEIGDIIVEGVVYSRSGL